MTDITRMTDDEIRDYLRQQAEKRRQLQLLKGVEARKDVEAYCLKKHGMTLAMIFTATDKAPKSYRSPTGETWHGKGKKPEWLKGHEAQYLEANGAA